MYDGKGSIVKQWFGGGSDLTLLFGRGRCCTFPPSDEKHVRQHNILLHQFKSLHTYFFNSHRDETRGIGGIFYDYLQKDKHVLGKAIGFPNELKLLLNLYPIVEKHKQETYRRTKILARDSTWAIRKFNLLRQGNTFPLLKPRRTESILRSSFYRSMGLRFPNRKRFRGSQINSSAYESS